MEDWIIGVIVACILAVALIVLIIILCWKCKKFRVCLKDDVENQIQTISGKLADRDVSSVSGLENKAFQSATQVRDSVHVQNEVTNVQPGDKVKVLQEIRDAQNRVAATAQKKVLDIEQQRLEQQRLEQQRLEQQRLEQQRLEQQRLEQQRLEQQRLQQQRLEQQRLEKQRLEQQRLEQQRLQQQRREQQRLEQQRLEQQRLEQQRLEQQRLEQQRLEQQRLEQQRLEQQRLEQQRLQQQRLEQQRLQQQRLEQQRLEQQRVEQQRLEQQRLEQQQWYVQVNTLTEYDDEEDDDEEDDDDEEEEEDNRGRGRRRGRSRQRDRDKSRHRSESGDFSRKRETTDPNKTIDLHYLSLQDAMNKVMNFLKAMENDYHNSNFRRVDRFVHIITGRGLHSRNRIPIIKPAVQSYLDKHNYTHEWKNSGGLVTIDLFTKRRNYM
ncbi:trichohyalin [Biomphalaria glabrata]|nr:trichohyalin [Biomphalaria glabrata]